MIYEAGGDTTMNRTIMPFNNSTTVITTKRSSEKRKDISNTHRQLIHILSIAFIALIASFLIILIKAYFDGEFRSVESLQKYIGKYGAFGPGFLIAFQAIQVVLPVLPGFVGCAAGSVMFGPAVGFWCNYIGIAGGSIIAFFLARKYGMPLLNALFPSGKYFKWSDWASRSKSYTAFLFMAMLLPLFPDDYLCYLTGVSKMTARRFIWIIILGKPWCILAYSLGFSLIQ